MNDGRVTILYGDEKPMMFDCRCSCGRLLKMPDEIEYTENGLEEVVITSKAKCSRCGEIDLKGNFEGFYSNEEIMQ
jgi:hypothetical protein